MKPYNIIKKSIENGLSDVELGTAGGYIIVLDAPVSANVTIKLNEQNSDGIPLEKYQSIEAEGVTKVYLSADAVAGGVVVIAQAKTAKDFKINPQISKVDIDSIGAYDPMAIAQLDGMLSPLIALITKAADKYNDPILTTGDSASTSNTAILNKTLSCDKIRLQITSLCTWGNEGIVKVYAEVGGKVVLSHTWNSTWQSGANPQIELEGVRGKTLKIYVQVSNATNHRGGYALEEFTLKA